VLESSFIATINHSQQKKLLTVQESDVSRQFKDVRKRELG